MILKNKSFFSHLKQLFTFSRFRLIPNFDIRMSSIGNLLSNNSRHFDIFNAVGEMGASSKNPTFLVGGYVRDLLMGKTGNDIDILVENDGIGFAQKLSKKLKAEGFVAYEKFGTAQIILDDLKVEIATARTETYSSDSRNPKVVFTNINEVSSSINRS